MQKNKNVIVITGGAGFIGTHLFAELLAQGILESQIIIVDKKPNPFSTHSKLTYIQGDLCNASVAKKATRNADIIYHLAATSGFGGETINDYRNGNVTTTRNILNAIKTKPIKKFVFFSTVAVYGLPSSIGDIRGLSEEHNHTYSEMYGQSKEEAELLIKEYSDKYAIPYSIIRPASVYGPHDLGQLFGMYRAIDSGYFFVIGNGDNVLDFVYVTDVVKGAILAEKTPRSTSEYILASGNPTSMNSIAKLVARSIGKPQRFLHIPKRIMLPTSYAIQWLSTISGINIPLFPSRVKIMTSSYFYNISKAKKELGYNPTISFSQGAQLTGQWYKHHRK